LMGHGSKSFGCQLHLFVSEKMLLVRTILLGLSASACVQIPATPINPPLGQKNQAIVVDIDGTLTPGVMNVKELRPDAVRATNAYAKKGYQVLYVTTRSPLAQSQLPKWLTDNNFPDGPLHVAQTQDQRDHPAEYKANILNQYTKLGWHLSYGYGDSSTDFLAYGNSGLTKDRVFALKRRHADKCQDGIYAACLDGWTEHLPFIEALAPQVQ
jgi:HAD superfamily, subfamily IIIB (Acid phosphatase)